MSELTIITEDIIEAEKAFIASRLNAAEHMSSAAKAAVHYGDIAIKLRDECASDKAFEARLVQLGSQLQYGEVAKLMKLAARVQREGVNVFLARNTAAQAQVEMGLLPESSTPSSTRTDAVVTVDAAISAIANAVTKCEAAILTTKIESWQEQKLQIAKAQAGKLVLILTN